MKKKNIQTTAEVRPAARRVEMMGDDILITLIRILLARCAATGEVANVN